jgi:hypothetical protein
MIDTKLYSVVWADGRRGPMTKAEAVAFVTGLRIASRDAGRVKPLRIHVFYRDGAAVPFADLARSIEPTYLGNTWQECRQIARDYLADAIGKRDAGEHRFADEYLADARRMIRVSLLLRVEQEFGRVPDVRAL